MALRQLWPLELLRAVDSIYNSWPPQRSHQFHLIVTWKHQPSPIRTIMSY